MAFDGQDDLNMQTRFPERIVYKRRVVRNAV